ACQLLSLLIEFADQPRCSRLRGLQSSASARCYSNVKVGSGFGCESPEEWRSPKASFLLSAFESPLPQWAPAFREVFAKLSQVETPLLIIFFFPWLWCLPCFALTEVLRRMRNLLR